MPTNAQVAALKMIQRRDWPAGEPKADWINASTLKVILRNHWVVPCDHSQNPILKLTKAGQELVF